MISLKKGVKYVIKRQRRKNCAYDHHTMMITLVLYYFLYNLDIFKNSENGKTIPSKFNNNLPTFLVCLFPKISMIYKIAKMQERELYTLLETF